MPFSNVPTSTNLVSELDFFAWPCISGEKYPPSNGTYAARAGYTVYRCANGVTVTWPNVPLISPRTRVYTGYTATMVGYLTATANAVNTFTFPGALVLIVTADSGGTTSTMNFTVNGVSQALGSGLPNVNDAVFHTFSVLTNNTAIGTSSPTVKWYVDSVLINTTQIGSISGTSTGFGMLAGTNGSDIAAPNITYS